MTVICNAISFAQVKPATAKWQRTEAKSEMDDSKTIVLKLSAETPIAGWLTKSVVPSLIIRCKEKRTDLYIVTDMAANPERGDGFSVRLRLDSKEAVRETWSESTSKDSLFSHDAVALATSLENTSTFLFEFTPFNSAPQLVRFDVRGLQPELTTLSQACLWPSKEEMAFTNARLAIFTTTGIRLPDKAFEFQGVRLPIPIGSDLRPSDSPNTVSFFAITTGNTRPYFKRAMPLFGWNEVSDPDCWTTRPADNKTRKACLDLSKDNRITFTFFTP